MEASEKREVNSLRKMEFEASLRKATYFSFGGAGTRASAYLGFLSYLQKWDGYETVVHSRLKGTVGVSSGSMVALAMLVGADMQKVLSSMQECTSRQTGGILNVDVSQLLNRYGIDDGRSLRALIGASIQSMGLETSVTFRELYRMTGKEYSVVVTRVRDATACVMNHKTRPRMQIKKAIYMSCTLPFLFTPDTDEEGEMYCDGGMVENVPFSHFPVEKTIVLTIEWNHVFNVPVNGIRNFGIATALCLFTCQRCSIEYHKEKNEGRHHIYDIRHESLRGDPVSLDSDNEIVVEWFKAGVSNCMSLLTPSMGRCVGSTTQVVLSQLLLRESNNASVAE